MTNGKPMPITNIFLDLSRYLHEENYFTNGFAFLLENNRELLDSFLEKLTRYPAESLRKERIKVASQVYYPEENTIVDIRISAGDKLVFLIENKIGANITEKQIDQYCEIKENLRGSANAQVFLLLFTMLKKLPPWLDKRVKGEDLVHCSWSRINYLLKTIPTKSDDARYKYCLTEFLKFMESKGMRSFSGFKPKRASAYAKYWEGFSEFRGNAESILNEVQKLMADNGMPGSNPTNKPEDKIEENVEYMGYSFRISESLKWKFYYWIGFMLIPPDKRHISFRVELRLKKTVRATLLKKKYSHELAKAEKKLGNKFKVSWTPLGDDIEYGAEDKELLELIKGAESIEAQKDNIVRFVRDALENIENSGIIKLAEKVAKEKRP